jgi:hypothetical protein
LEAEREMMDFDYERINQQMVSTHAVCDVRCAMCHVPCVPCIAPSCLTHRSSSYPFVVLYPFSTVHYTLHTTHCPLSVHCPPHHQALLKSVDACLLRLLEGTTTPEQVVASEKSLMCKELFLRLVELTNAEPTQAEKDR